MRLWPRVKKSEIALPMIALPAASALTPSVNTTKKKTRKLKLKVPAAVRQRFEGYLDKKSRACWAWRGSRTADGYGQFWINDRKVVKAHRFAYEIYVRQLSKKERLKNVCTGKNCINPACWQPVMIGAARVRRKKA